MDNFDTDEYSVEINKEYLTTDFDYIENNREENEELDTFGEDIEFE